MSTSDILQLGFLSGTDFFGYWTAWMEPATERRIDRTGNVALEYDSLLFLLRIGLWNGRHQRDGIRMERIIKELLLVGKFGDLSQVHYGHPLADMFHNAQIVSDEEIGQAEFFLKIVQQIENLGLNRDVKGRDGFVADYEFWIENQSPGDSYTLSLPSAEFVWESGHMIL